MAKKSTTKKESPKSASSQDKKSEFRVKNPLWLSASHGAVLLGVKKKTIKRAIKSNLVKYKIEGRKYLIEFESLIKFAHCNRRLENKLYQEGIGQYIKSFKNWFK